MLPLMQRSETVEEWTRNDESGTKSSKDGPDHLWGCLGRAVPSEGSPEPGLVPAACTAAPAAAELSQALPTRICLS